MIAVQLRHIRLAMAAGTPFAIIEGERNGKCTIHLYTSVGCFEVQATAEKIRQVITEAGNIDELFGDWSYTPIHLNPATASPLKESLNKGVQLGDMEPPLTQGDVVPLPKAFGQYYDASVKISEVGEGTHVRRAIGVTESMVSYMITQPDMGFVEISYTFAQIRASGFHITDAGRQFGDLVFAKDTSKESWFITPMSRHVIPGVELADIVIKDLAAIRAFMVERNIVGV